MSKCRVQEMFLVHTKNASNIVDEIYVVYMRIVRYELVPSVINLFRAQ